MKFRILIAFIVLGLCVCPVLSRPQTVRVDFPGGDLLLLPNQQFVYEATDVSNLFPTYVKELDIQTITNVGPQADAKLLLTLYTKDNRYYLVVLGDGAGKALGQALKHAGLAE